MNCILAHSLGDNIEWFVPFLWPGQWHLVPELAGLDWDQRLGLCQEAERRFNELASESGSTAVWSQIQAAVFATGTVLESGVEAVCGTTRRQLIEWRDKAVREALSGLENGDA